MPRALRIVAWLFLLGGINSALTIIACALNNRLQLDFGVLGIFVFFGLMHFSSGWRTCALVLIGLSFVLIPLIAIAGLFAPEGHIDIFGQKIASIPPIFVSVISMAWMALALWEWRVLNRPDIVGLFHDHRLRRPEVDGYRLR
jgi:hypothetical protein